MGTDHGSSSIFCLFSFRSHRNVQCQDIEDDSKIKSKKAYQLVKFLTSKKKKFKLTLYRTKTEAQDIIKRWTEYCTELHSHIVKGDPDVLNVLACLVDCLDKPFSAFGIEISEEKTKLTTNTGGISIDIKDQSEK